MKFFVSSECMIDSVWDEDVHHPLISQSNLFVVCRCCIQQEWPLSKWICERVSFFNNFVSFILRSLLAKKHNVIGRVNNSLIFHRSTEFLAHTEVLSIRTFESYSLLFASSVCRKLVQKEAADQRNVYIGVMVCLCFWLQMNWLFRISNIIELSDWIKICESWVQ